MEWHKIMLIVFSILAFLFIVFSLLRLIGTYNLQSYPCEMKKHAFVSGNPSLTSTKVHYEIPKVIWCFWHSPDLPEFIAFNMKRWHRILGLEYEIRLLHETTLHQYVAPDEILSEF